MRPSRATPMAMFVGLPPTIASKPVLSSKGRPTLWEYRSRLARPMATRSMDVESMAYSDTGKPRSTRLVDSEPAASGHRLITVLVLV